MYDTSLVVDVGWPLHGSCSRGNISIGPWYVCDVHTSNSMGCETGGENTRCVFGDLLATVVTATRAKRDGLNHNNKCGQRERIDTHVAPSVKLIFAVAINYDTCSLLALWRLFGTKLRCTLVRMRESLRLRGKCRIFFVFELLNTKQVRVPPSVEAGEKFELFG